MNSCKICGKPLTTTPEYDMCIECQGEQFRKLTMPYMSGRTSNTSKDIEMTPKENIVSKARASISWIYSNLLGRKANIQLLSEIQRQVIEDEYVSWVSYLLPIEDALTELEELKRYPTADEVCKALGEYLERTVKMDIDNTFYYSDENKLGEYDEIICGYGWEHKHHTVEFDMQLPPHLITLIGRFYEGLEKVGKE